MAGAELGLKVCAASSAPIAGKPAPTLTALTLGYAQSCGSRLAGDEAGMPYTRLGSITSTSLPDTWLLASSA